MAELTQERLKELMIYDPDTGVFKRATTRGRWKAGQEVGCVDTLGYVQVCIDYVFHRAHRLAWMYVNGDFPNKQIDHINGVKTDNRFCNLRECSHTQNSHNRGKQSNNTSGFKGVHFDRRCGRWHASIKVGDLNKSLGYHLTPEKAHEAYSKAAFTYHGEFARVI